MKKIIIIVLVSIIILFLGFNIYKAVKDLDKKIIPKNMKINDKILSIILNPMKVQYKTLKIIDILLYMLIKD